VRIVVRASQGLGNQLFQYAAGKYYAKRYAAAMKIAVDPARNAQCYGYPRPFLLSHFQIPVPMEQRSFSDRLLVTDNYRLVAASARLRRVSRTQLFTEPYEDRYRFLRDLPLERNVETLYLVGYWENNLLVEEVAADLRVDLAFKGPARGKTLEILEQIRQSKNPVSLHVRRGDSMIPREGKVVLPMRYYADAISIIKERLVDPVFFVFSDDMPLAKEILPRDEQMVFVEHNDDFAAHEDLRLMSSCHHHIIANSTFSWWGAWLNARPDKIVVAPRHWFTEMDNYYPSLFPRDWILYDFIGAEKFSLSHAMQL
jgi:Glycosyl transferase family 11